MIRFTEIQKDCGIRDNKWVVNLSSHELTEGEKKILEKSPKFAPAPKEIPRLDIISGVEDALRRTKVTEEELEKVRASIASFVRKAKCPKSNITADKHEVLASLRTKMT